MQLTAPFDGILDMEASEAARLERRVAQHPEDLAARLRLMAFLQRADRDAIPADRAKRWNLSLWMIENHPELEHVYGSLANFGGGTVTAAQLEQVRQLWARATARHPRSAVVTWNAALFFQNLDSREYLNYLESTAALDPNHPHALRPLAFLYGKALLSEDTALARRAEAQLDRSGNVWVLGNAANFLQLYCNQGGALCATNDRIATLAERYFLRAQKIDPNLKREVVIPRAAPRVAAPSPADLTRQFLAAEKRILRLSVDRFPALPDAVAGVLRARRCTVPQPAADAGGSRKPANVISGEFVEKGLRSWAVLCSQNGVSSLLVFRDDTDTKPRTVHSSEDRGHLQGLGGDSIGYSREIAPVGEKRIIRYYRAYGGPKPPLIDHDGIEDAFLGKASSIWYYAQGKWRVLQGAD